MNVRPPGTQGNFIPPTAIYRERTPEELELQHRREELAAKRAVLATREQSLHDLRGQLFSFEGRYIRQVGVLYRQLDEWEQRTAELHTGKKQSGEPEDEFFEEEADSLIEQEPDPQRFDLKALYRGLAKRIHPDFALDAADENRRTRLMAQANDALRRQDLQTLQRMLHGFEVSTARTAAQDIAASTAEALAQIRQTELDIESAKADFHTLERSELASLQQQTIEAAQDGRDLLAEMAARVKGRIGLAMRQYELDLDRIKRPAKGLSVESLVTAETYREPLRTPRCDARRRTWVR